MDKNIQLNNNEKECLFQKTIPVINSIEDNSKKFSFLKGEYKDLKEIIDLQSDSKNKQFFLLVRKRLREPENSEGKSEKVLEKFNKLSLNTTTDDKHDTISDSKTNILNENNLKCINEIDSKELILENINKNRRNKIFSKNPQHSIKRDGHTKSAFMSFYPSEVNKDFFTKTKDEYFNEEIRNKEILRENGIQDNFWEKRKNLKGFHNPDFEQIKTLFNDCCESEMKYINIDDENMLIIANGTRLKKYELEKFYSLLHENGLTPAVQLFEMDNNLNLLNTQELVNEEETNYKKNIYEQDDFDSNEEDNPINEYPDESDEYEEKYNTKNYDSSDQEKNNLIILIFTFVIAMKRLSSEKRSNISQMIVALMTKFTEMRNEF